MTGDGRGVPRGDHIVNHVFDSRWVVILSMSNNISKMFKTRASDCCVFYLEQNTDFMTEIEIDHCGVDDDDLALTGTISRDPERNMREGGDMRLKYFWRGKGLRPPSLLFYL